MKSKGVTILALLFLLLGAAIAQSELRSPSDDPRLRAALKQADSLDAIMGAPREINGMTLIPLATISFGSAPSGAAGGIAIPSGVLIVSKDNTIRALHLSKGVIEQLASGFAPVFAEFARHFPNAAAPAAFKIDSGRLMAFYWKIFLVVWLLWGICAALTQIFFPQHVSAVAMIFSGHAIQISIFGLFGFGAMVLLALIFTISIIGIPLTFAVIILTGLLTLLGSIGFALFIGQQAATTFKYHYSEMRLLLIGGILFGLFGFIPFAGLIVWALIAVFGFGAVVQTQLSSYMSKW